MYVKASADNLTSFIKFDVSTVPSTENIQRAVLRLYHAQYTGTGTPTISIQQITSADWAEGTIVYTGQPTGTGFSEDTAVIGAATLDTWIEIDITRLVRGWKETGINNYGIKISSNLDTCVAGFRTHDYATAAQRPHIRVYSNIASDGKVYKAEEPGVGYFSYNTVRHIVGFAAETKNADEAIKIYDTPGSVSGLSIGNVVAGSILYVSSSAGEVTTSPINLTHLTQAGVGKGAGNILLAPLKPLLIEQFPINDINITLATGGTIKFFTPSDCVKFIIYYTADDQYDELISQGTLTAIRVGSVKDSIVLAADAFIDITWVQSTITLTNSSNRTMTAIKAYFYSK